MSSHDNRPSILKVEDLVTRFNTAQGTVFAVNGVSFDLQEGETLGVVGESGCGKSVTMLSVLQLIPRPPGKIVRGQVLFHENDLLQLTSEEIRHIRGAQIAMVFQDPMTSLNPVLTIGVQVSEPLMLHLGMNKREAEERTVELLSLVGISEAEKRLGQYPHHFSGGMRQRVMIAMALSTDPDLLIADEPTTALDVTIQAQILELIREVQDRTGAALMLITHDLGVVAETVHAAARALVDMLENYRSPVEQAECIKELEHKADTLTHNLMTQLNQTFITPFDREDIHELCSQLDDVIDLIDAAASAIPL